MSNKSIHYTTGGMVLQAPAVQKTAQTSSNFNRKTSGGQGAPFEALELLLVTGAYTDGNHSWVVNEADDNGSGSAGAFTAVAASDLLGAFAAVNSRAGQNAVQRVAYVGKKQYVQVVSTETGTTGLLYGIVAIPGYPRNLPTVASGS